ncbi:PAS domain-containing hybrid sensor histidine kinase/response regulator [Mucilaginibacter ginsenosidivorax]|uniref:histidine kinase n=1 Tax=Mucilaginibacter ginsenosidivorax TaxID=862126 RepID=A0A5B8VX13_9SPHI|nr:PAS domain-containing hybrid sensor histidine kinase/response regulator [Mucilaginibacter ginsenosidivorax]QEC74946.1 PAS domain S-box protein [Mucilaginibacter ginsenosidivorax]
MSLKVKTVLIIQNDETIYRLLLIGLFIASPSLHYLCYYNSYDPIWLRFINSFLCIISLGLSFVTNKTIYTVSTYVTIFSFLIINNYFLLSINGFEHAYLFSSITIFIALTLFCKKGWEFVVICGLNLLAIIAAYINAPQLNISLPVLVVLIIIFTIIAYVSFLVVKAYQYRLKNAVDKMVNLNNNLHSLIGSFNDMVFEFDETRLCLNVWYNELIERSADPKALLGKRLEEALPPDRAKKYIDCLDYVIANRLPMSIEFVSDYGTNQWFRCNMMPIYDRNGNYTGRISAALIDISEQKKNADALKANEALLLEAQAISKTGNWWYDSITAETYWSDNLFSLLEIESIPANISKFHYYISLIHPDDRKNAEAYLSSVHHTTLAQFEHKFITPKGTLKYIKIIRGNLLQADDGSSKRIFGVLQDITEAKLSEKAVKVSQVELMEAQTIAKIGNWKWNLATNLLSWSEELNIIHEVSAPDLLGVKQMSLLLKYVHPNDRHVLKQLLRKPENLKDISQEYRIITPNGNIKYLSVIIGKLMKRDDGSIRKIIGTLQDVTERKQAELDYRQSESKYKLVLETINLAAVTLDKNGNVIFCNKYLTKLLGYSQAEIVGMNWMDNFIPHDLKNFMHNWFKNNAVEAHFINPIICRNGEERVMSWQNTIILDENGDLRETTSIGEDITEQQKARQELIWAKEVAEKASKFKSEFLSIMSHEIRTPMNAVIGTTNLLLSENPRPEQLEYLNTLKFSGENLLAIINDILDYNKIEAGKLELNKSPFNLHQLIHKIKQSFHPRVAEKHLSLDVVIDESIPEMVTGDNMRLSQVLNNLVSNAVKFTHIGGVSIKLEKEMISNTVVTVKFTVTDTGIGISPDSFDIVFDPFMQDKQVINNDYGGTGLGLAITKRLVELHNSTISVTSELGKGTSFIFAIAFNIAPKTIGHQAVTPAVAGLTFSLTGMNILVVDDNKMNLMIATRFLRKWNASADEALNGEIAVNMVNNNKYNLIIMDLQMPVMDGFEATAIIKKLHPHMPIIALTADAMPETYNKALEAGMSDYLTKPFAPEALFEKAAKYYHPAVNVNQ